MLFIKEMAKLTERMAVLARTNQIIEIVKDVLLRNDCDTDYLDIEEQTPGIHDNKGFDDIELTYWLNDRPYDFNKDEYETTVTIEISQETDCNEPLFGGKSPWNRVTIGFRTIAKPTKDEDKEFVGFRTVKDEEGNAARDTFEIDIRKVTAHSIEIREDCCHFTIHDPDGNTIDPEFRDGKMRKIYDEIMEGLQTLNFVNN